jgi:hypothetical protein
MILDFRTENFAAFAVPIRSHSVQTAVSVWRAAIVIEPVVIIKEQAALWAVLPCSVFGDSRSADIPRKPDPG